MSILVLVVAVRERRIYHALIMRFVVKKISVGLISSDSSDTNLYSGLTGRKYYGKVHWNVAEGKYEQSSHNVSRRQLKKKCFEEIMAERRQ